MIERPRMKSIVLGISGKMGVGKNHVSEHLIIPHLIDTYRRTHRIQLIPSFFSFGSFIKSELYARDGSLTYESLFDQKTHATRTRLQEYGTDLGRQGIRKDMWIRYVELWMRIQQESLHRCQSFINVHHHHHHDVMPMIPLFVIQDIRFENELAFVMAQENALVIRIDAPDRHALRVASESSNGAHVSETALDSVPFPHTIKNDQGQTHETLTAQVRTILDVLTKHV